MSIVPFILIIAIIVGVIGRFSNIQETQRDFLQALFDRSVPIASFLDDTPEGVQTHDFIVFVRQELLQVENAALLIFHENDIVNLETRTDLSGREIRENDNIMPDTAILRMKVVYYSMFLHQFSPLPIHANEDEILAYMGVDTQIDLEFTDGTEDIYTPQIRNPWDSFWFTDYDNFVQAFFEMEPPIELYDGHFLPGRGLFLWERVDNNQGDSPFFNATIYKQIQTNVGILITSQHETLIETIWKALTMRMFVHFSGRFATPIEPQHMSSITSPFGYRADPITGRRSFHSGVDFAWAGCLGAPIFTAYDGIVLQAHDTGNGFGIMVIVEHPNGWQTWYAHASEVFVRVGEQVEAGQRIASIGSTGRSTGPHLHFELRIANQSVDPMQLFR